MCSNSHILPFKLISVYYVQRHATNQPPNPYIQGCVSYAPQRIICKTLNCFPQTNCLKQPENHCRTSMSNRNGEIATKPLLNEDKIKQKILKYNVFVLHCQEWFPVRDQVSQCKVLYTDTAKLEEDNKIHSKATIIKMYGQRENMNIQKGCKNKKAHAIMVSSVRQQLAYQLLSHS